MAAERVKLMRPHLGGAVGDVARFALMAGRRDDVDDGTAGAPARSSVLRHVW